MMNTKFFLITTLTLGMASVCFAQTTSSPTSPTTTTTSKGSSAPYNEGPVWTITMIKTKAGLSDEYIKQITGTVKPVYDEEKKQKIILDFNILILVEYPNWAAFDSLRDKMDPVIAKVMGSEEQRRDLAVKRLDIREILGTKTMREITLK